MGVSRAGRVLVFAAVAAGLAVLASAPRALTAASGALTQDFAIRQTTESGLAAFAVAQGDGFVLPLPPDSPAEDRALAFVDAHGRGFGLTGRSQVRLARPPRRDELGLEHVRFQQLHQGVPVAGGEFLVHLRGNRVTAANGRVLERLPSDTQPSVLPAVAIDLAEDVVRKYRPQAAAGASYSEPRLEILNRGFLQQKSEAVSRLVWFIEATGPALREFIWIDARRGGVLLHFNQLHTALSRQIYNANNTSITPGTLARLEGEPPTGNADVDAAYDQSGITYNFFLNRFGRDSFNGAGAPIMSTVNWNGGPGSCPNAYWNGTQMVYCAGFASADDVVGHELTHAVNQFEASLFYYVQSGALNESFADILGESIDLANVTGADTPGTRWYVGEDLPGGAVRHMMDPTILGSPGKMSDGSQFWCNTESDNGGVHVNSGVPNHAYALMVDGGSYNGYTVGGIGLVKAAKIQYRALTTYLTNSSGFLDDFNAVNQSCSDLIGTDGITSADCAQVNQAMVAVEMNAAWGCVDPFYVVEPAMCPAGGTPAFVFNDGFEDGGSQWVVSSTTSTQWGLNLFNVFEGGMAYFGPDPATASDHSLMTGSGVTLPAGARAMFTHAVDFEFFFDGGVVEYSTNGGATWADATVFVDGGLQPDGEICEFCGNPLAGRLGWSLPSYGYKASRLDLASLAGQDARLRFRIGTDGAFGAIGWMVDNVAIYSCTVAPGAPTISAQPAPQVVATGGQATFTVVAAGNPALRYQWLKNNTPIPGATTSTLLVPNVQSADYGFYSVIVSNDQGTARSDGAGLLPSANSLPTFTKQPVNTTVAAGQTARFAADAFGATSFQWQVSTNGGASWSPLADAPPYSGATTRALTITGATTGLTNNQYRLIASNGSGNSQSRHAILTVLASNIVTNGSFGTGDTTGWALFETPAGNMEFQVAGGEFRWNRLGNASTQATIFQNTGVSVSGAPLEASFDLGNSANIRQRVSVLMLDADFSDLVVCTFWLEPAAPMRTYRMRTHTNRPWTNAALYFYAATTASFAANGGFIRLDNVAYSFDATGSSIRTDSVDPTSPAPPGGAESANLLANGEFSSGLAPWGMFGTITGGVTNGVFEFIRTSGLPAGVVLQATGAAVSAAEFLTATVDLGNSSPMRKRVTLLIHSNDFSDLSACTFVLPAGLPLSTYQMKMRATRAWTAGTGTGATFSIYGATVGLDQWIRVDNASLRRTPGSAIQGTECLEPGEVLVPASVRAAATVSIPGSPAAALQRDGEDRRDGGRVFRPGTGHWTASADGSGIRELRLQRAVDLRGVTTARLAFASSLTTPSGEAEVQVSLDGETWTTVARVPPGEAWMEIDVDLSEYAGLRVHVRFLYQPAGGEAATWRVGNVRVTRRN
jgi:Zn-dependent metalloprotease